MKIAVRGLAVSADIGINPDEIGRQQTLAVDVVLSVDRMAADEIGATVDYREIVRAAETLGAGRIALIETFAARLAETLLRDRRVRKAKVTVAKPSALASGVASAGVSLRRSSPPPDLSRRDGTGRSDAEPPASTAA